MYFILSRDGTKAFYLFEDREYIVGRKECDILIKDDTSISRKHASISVKDGKIQITDLGAKYNTFLNDVQLQANVATDLNLNDEVKFGILKSIYIIKQQKLNVISSGLITEEKKILTKFIRKLNGNILLNWSKECSHLTVREIMLTLKVLCALIEKQPIVTFNFWTDFMENVKKNLPPPDENNYKPVHANKVLSKNIDNTNENVRKTLFQNKTFVFKTKASKAKIEAVVELAGGTCICWNEKHITKEKVSSNNPQYLFIEDSQNASNNNDSFINMIRYLNTIGKRSIPFQEIAMAIVASSSDKYCNPDSDRILTLIQHDHLGFSYDILVPETQTQDIEVEDKSSVIIPETPELPTIPKQLDTNEKLNECNSGIKREGQQMGNDKKKARLENPEENITYSSVFGHELSQSCQEMNIVTSTQNMSEIDEDIDIKPLEEIDRILNDTDEINSYIASMNKKACSKGTKESESLKRTGQKLNNDENRKRLEEGNEEVCHKIEEEKSYDISENLTNVAQSSCKIVTSTQIGTTVQNSSKIDNQNQKSTNPFGFIRCLPKTKTTTTTAKVSDFFKPLSKSIQNAEESIANISRIDTDLLSTTGKRKSSDEASPSTSNKRQTLSRNPFSLNKPFKTLDDKNPFKKTPGDNTSNVHNAATKKFNPFSELRKTHQKIAKETDDSTNKSTFVPYTFNITAVDLGMERNHGWLSKNITVKDEVDNSSKSISHIDENMLKFMETFRNCVIVETIPFVERVSVYKEASTTISSTQNFKKFKKVQPLHMQTIIIPKSSYHDVICNESQVIDESFYRDEV